MKENYTVCNCAKVSYGDIVDALHDHNKMEDVIDVFKDVQNVTHCTTGCGGCYQKVLDIISEVLMG
jgi:NAD(P)H-nitrite reductase large subunit